LQPVPPSIHFLRKKIRPDTTEFAMNHPDRQQSFERALREHADRVARIASAYERDPHRVDDLVQEVFLAFWRALPSFRGDASTATFLARIAHNVCVSHVRRAVREPRNEPDALAMAESDAQSGPESQTELHGRRERLLSAIRAMPLPLRQVVTLHLEGFSGREIAETLEISESNAAVRLTRARTLLRRTMGADQ
jgi:RNA polymerase sigma-70 factor (ECF subfamily)